MTKVLLRLYVAGTSATSRQAERNFARLLSLVGSECRTEIVDVVARPDMAESAGILATPTLSFEHPVRPRRVIGDLSNPQKVIEFLGIRPKDDRT